MALPRRALALREVQSTNTVAMEAARAGDPGGLWITAERQLAGRGRRGRVWFSEPGNLYSSLLLIDPAPLTALANLPLVVALGVRDGLARLIPDGGPDVAIKWPNDVLIGEAKAVGILLESERLASGRLAVVVGCGVNVAHAPSDAPYAVTCLARHGATVALETVFATVASSVEAVIARWDRGRRFDDIRRAWLEHSIGRGSMVTVRMAEQTLSGVFEDLDASGRLVLRQASGQRSAVSAGDLFFGAM